jgi:putative methanogenesis marker protein 6
MLELPLTIKSTCYGAIIHGDEDTVMDAVNKIRKLDPYNIFTKDRGFPPGDPRRCRAKRGAAREGFHQLEKEYELLDCLREALENPKEVHVKKPKKIEPDSLKEIIAEYEK